MSLPSRRVTAGVAEVAFCPDLETLGRKLNRFLSADESTRSNTKWSFLRANARTRACALISFLLQLEIHMWYGYIFRGRRKKWDWGYKIVTSNREGLCGSESEIKSAAFFLVERYSEWETLNDNERTCPANTS